MNILFASSEMAPFARTGGLGDVSGSLPGALASLGHRVTVVMPFYRQVKDGSFNIRKLKMTLKVPFRDKVLRTSVFHTALHADVPVYFIRQDEYFGRSNLYGTPKGDYRDNAERFMFFCRAVLHLTKSIAFQPDIIHCHDWQTALLPVYLKSVYTDDPFFRQTRTLFTIHNLAYQGVFSRDVLKAGGLPESLFSMAALEFYGKVNLMKGGILFSDLVTTVSKKYAREILTPEYGYGLDGVLRTRKKDVFGVLNGVDYRTWNPETDPHIAANYSSDDLSGKKECKEDLLADFKIGTGTDIPIIGIVSRLAAQKGFDILDEALEDILDTGSILILLGAGDAGFERRFAELGKKHEAVGIKIGFDDVLAHKIEAGSDMFLMPSRYEPCGMNQMYSLRYGTIPIVRATGGLDDTIRAYDPRKGAGNGFKFRGYSARDLLKAVRKAVSVFRKHTLWSGLMINAMKEDFSWAHSASEYVDLYHRIRIKKTVGIHRGRSHVRHS
ncbi:MAG: glycogen synthase GlgA [Candidatus Aminicenantes bacterium]|nr:glycogen synthase GlgA [Candidatus Aminicenantes bacterium]